MHDIVNCMCVLDIKTGCAKLLLCSHAGGIPSRHLEKVRSSSAMCTSDSICVY